MKTPAQREAEIVNMLVDLFASKRADLGKHRVLLFGSRARGNATQRSDFDIGVDGDQPLPIDTFYELEDALESLPTLYSFDWVDLARANSRFREEALNSARVIYEA